MANEQNFSALDYVIFGLLLLISASIGVFFGFFGKKATSSKELLVADRKMGLFPTAMSLLASFMSGITILGNPSESYNYGTMFWWAALAYTFSVSITAHIFIPLFVELDITSGYEYLEKRFSRSVKILASCMFIVQMTIYMALVLYAPALAMNQVTGINIWILVCSITVVCTFYTTIGGMKAVMWTDVFQIVIMLIGLLSSLIVGIQNEEGIKNIVEENWKTGRIEFFEFSVDPTVRHTVWSCSIGLGFNWLAIYGCNQSQVQRYLSVPSVKIARRAIYWNLLGLWAILSLTLTIGMIIFSKYKDCDPILNGEVSNGEQLFPLFVIQTLKPYTGLPGLFLACLFSAALSTISSGLNSLATVFLEDILKGNIKAMDTISTKLETRLTKLLCVIFGALCLVITVVVSYLGNLLQAALSLFGVIGGPVLGVFLLGIFFPFSNSYGAFIGTSTSLILLTWIFVGANVYNIKYVKKPFSIAGCDNSTATTVFEMFSSTTTTKKSTLANELTGIERFHAISYTWYGLYAVLIVLIVGVVVSLITGPKKPNEVDSKLMLSFFDMFPLPLRLRKYLRFGYHYKNEDDTGDNVVHPMVEDGVLKDNEAKVAPISNESEILRENSTSKKDDVQMEEIKNTSF